MSRITSLGSSTSYDAGSSSYGSASSRERRRVVSIDGRRAPWNVVHEPRQELRHTEHQLAAVLARADEDRRRALARLRERRAAARSAPTAHHPRRGARSSRRARRAERARSRRASRDQSPSWNAISHGAGTCLASASSCRLARIVLRRDEHDVMLRIDRAAVHRACLAASPHRAPPPTPAECAARSRGLHTRGDGAAAPSTPMARVTDAHCNPPGSCGKCRKCGRSAGQCPIRCHGAPPAYMRTAPLYSLLVLAVALGGCTGPRPATARMRSTSGIKRAPSRAARPDTMRPAQLRGRHREQARRRLQRHADRAEPGAHRAPLRGPAARR